MSTFPVGQTEQILYLQKLARQHEEILAASHGVVLHSFSEPTQTAWELAYIQQIGGTLPIPAGARLNWYDMKSGVLRHYTVTWDRDNGLNSSGNVYKLPSGEDISNFRFLGRFDGTGLVKNRDNVVQGEHFGMQPWRRAQEGLVAIDLYFRVPRPSTVENYIFLDYGDSVVQVDFTGTIHRQLEGGIAYSGASPTSAAVSTATVARSYRAVNLLLGSGNQNRNKQTMATGCIRIYNPFGAISAGGEQNGVSQVSVTGWLFTPQTAYDPTSGTATNHEAIAYRQFASTKLTQLSLDKFWSIYQTTDSGGANDTVNVRAGFGYAYGYFETAPNELGER